ncbi:MAG: hypothetical protein MZV64_11600 [Ignavibacteriales bacterium]|nr:hypothetical protein [Ignavibacteriales bacterium]
MVGQAVGIPTVNITARVEGYLQDWSFEEWIPGQQRPIAFHHRAGQIQKQCRLHAGRPRQQDCRMGEAAKLDVARLKPLLSTNAISQNDYDVAVTTEKQTRAAVESAKSNLADAKLNLSYTTITSPHNGDDRESECQPRQPGWPWRSHAAYHCLCRRPESTSISR